VDIDNQRQNDRGSGKRNKKKLNYGMNGGEDVHVLKEHLDEIDHITLFNSPVICAVTLGKVLINLLLSLPNFILKNFVIFAGIPTLILMFFFVDGPHAVHRKEVKEFGIFAAWWIGLGIASSVGLGTGLHTFVLYLGPYMAKVTMAANECNSIPVFVPNRWTYESFAPCQKWTGEPTIGILEIYTALSIEAFLWGLGTAIGELPPYFVAKAASLAGRKHEELIEIETEIKENSSIFDKLKGLLYSALKKYAFIVVLLCASIPNPLFDLAGLTCGHFLIPFWTFFGATFIGKALIKVSIQSFFVIIMFSVHTVSRLIKLAGSIIPSAEEFLTVELEKQKRKLYEAKVADEDQPLLAKIWNYVIMIMIAYFIYAFLNAIVQNQLKYDEEAKTKKSK